MNAIIVEVTETAWRKCWADGFQPRLSTDQLRALALALASDDPRLLQGAATAPAALSFCEDWPCEGGDPIAFCAMVGGQPTVAEAIAFWGEACFECDLALGCPAGCRFFLNWWDEEPRDLVRRCLHAEVCRELSRRGVLQPLAV